MSTLQYNLKRMKKRDTDQLLGLMSGLLADNKLTEDEIIFLAGWLERHEHLRDTWAGGVIMDRVSSVLEDGIIEPDEIAQLKGTIESLMGGEVDDIIESVETPSAPSAIFHLDATIELEGAKVVLTGDFVSCTREEAIQRISAAGARVMSSVSSKTDYVIVGAIASSAWVHGNYGRKIERALELSNDGAPILIVEEHQWQKSAARL